MISRTMLGLLRLLSAAAALAGPCPLLDARQPLPEQAGGADAAQAADERHAGSGEVQIRLESFGFGEAVRPGDWAAIRLALTERTDRPRQAAVRMHLPDGDGDTALYTRIVTLNPGRESGVWLYARLPWDTASGSVVRVSVSDAESREDGTIRIGRQVAWRPVQTQRVIPAQDALFAVVGQTALGLEQFGLLYPERETAPAAHEAAQVVTGLTPRLMPDSWMGLAAYELIAWSRGDPASLPGDQHAAAIREWVHRGGHLVIVLPEVGGGWQSPANPLADLLPACRIERVEDADLSVYSMLLSGTEDAALPRRMGLHRFVFDEPWAGATPGDAVPILTGPHGCIAARRLLGAGMVTVIGIDLESRAIAARGAVRADAFWPRIIGRRAGAPTQAQVQQMMTRRGVLGGAPPSVWIDERIAGLISQGREAGLGVALGVVVFALYWLTAGPVGFALLRARGLERHAWLLFVAAAAIFTALAWAGAGVLRPKQERAWHFTLLDHVYGQPVQRTRSWVSVLLPTYGDQTVALGQPGADERWSQALTPWAAPDADLRTSFPDARSYNADVRRLHTLTTPARSTIRTFQADWLGGPRWSMPGPSGPGRAPTVDSAGRLNGELVHRLPGALTDVRVIYVQRQVAEGVLRRRDTPSPMPPAAEAFAWALDSWEPGVALNLAAFVPEDRARAEAKLRDLVPMMTIVERSLPGAVRDTDLEDAISLFGVLEQPDPSRPALGLGRMPATVRRRLCHGMDLARWFTQPCLIIIGRVEGAPTPAPMSVDGRPLDGRELASNGRTVVRWVYPLPPRPAVLGGGPGAAPPARPVERRP